MIKSYTNNLKKGVNNHQPFLKRIVYATKLFKYPVESRHVGVQSELEIKR